MQVKKQQLKPDMKQRTGSKLGKEHIKPVYCHLTYLTSRVIAIKKNDGEVNLQIAVVALRVILRTMQI